MISSYKDYSSVFRWKLTYVSFMQLRICFIEGMLWFLECWSYFVVDDIILLFVVLIELLGLVDAFFYCLWSLIWLFVFSYTTLKWVWKYYWPMMGMSWALKCWSARGMSGHESVWPHKGMFYPSSTGTLACIKSIVMSIESVLPPCLNNSQ
jgi:hypothetical protein